MDMKHKFKDLRIFASTEWLANNEKNYRLVYDESELSYIYCEFSFFNKSFDDQDWEVNIRLKCFGPDGAEICNLNCDRTVKKEDSVVFVREGWGVKNKGNYWKRGSYRWEAWIENKMAAERSFYVEHNGLANAHENPYFDINEIKIYEGPDANVPEQDRVYLKTFNSADTRYVWVELNAKNLLKEHDYWACELIFNFKTVSGQLKGSVDKLLFIYPGDEEIHCTVGWGSDIKGSWSTDIYTVELVFMNQIVAVIPFEIGAEEVEITDDEQIYYTPSRNRLQEKTMPETNSSKSFEELMSEMNGLIGLGGIKKKVHDYTSYLNFIKLRRKKGFTDTDKINLHAVFTGNPGTGKTTVARMLGKIYHNLGLLSKGHVYEVDRSELVAEFIGQTAPKTKEAIKKARGGILFIDEAYSLSRKDDDSKDFGKETIEVLVREMSDGEGDLAIVVAGYPEQMNSFLDSNPGLKSRFQMTFEYPDYKPDELEKIALYAAQKRMVAFSPEAQIFMYKKLVEAYRARNLNFGNARLVNNILDEAKMNLGLRIMQLPNPEELSKESLMAIEVADLVPIFEKKNREIASIPVDEDLLRDSMTQLSNMVGLTKTKTEIDELVKLVRYYRETGKDLRSLLNLHAVFTGNPGTGKTTVARILAQIYKALGILERGHLVECDRQGLVGNHIGSTALKTKEMIDKAMGGVLFIDEAYALHGSDNDFGKEAVETILKRMEDNRGEFIVIVAGYTEPMTRFIESNPGLKSRFDRMMVFEDYDLEQLKQIASKMLTERGILPDADAKTMLEKVLENIWMHRDKFFGNARAVRKLMDDAVKQQNLRLAAMKAEERTPEMVKTLTVEDVEHISAGPGLGSPTIGFQLGI